MNAMGPEDWMASAPNRAGRPRTEESAREWYHRTTKKWHRALWWVSMAAILVGLFTFVAAPFNVLARMQTWSGAIVIPIGAGIWIAGFVYIFLVPNREVGFRSMESLQRMEDQLESNMKEKILPVVAVWKRIGERVEHELPHFVEEGREAFETLKRVAAKIEATGGKNEELAQDAKPVLESLKRISDRFEDEIRTGLFEEARTAFEAVKNLSGIPKNATEPDISRALAAIKKKG